MIVDIFLSGKVNGLDFWHACKKQFPKLTFLVTSGLSSEAISRMSKVRENAPTYLQKPFFMNQCRDILKKILSAA